MKFNLSQLLESNLILEGRKEDAIRKYGEEHRELINLLSDADPSGNNKYLNWMVGASLGELEDNNNIPTADTVAKKVKDFHQQLPRIEKKDIGSYKTFAEFVLVVDEALAKAKEKRVAKEAAKVFENDDIVVYAPFTVEASCKYGAGSKWCIAATGGAGDTITHFDSYSRHSNFYFLINKNMSPNNGGDERRHYKYALQWRFDNGQEDLTWWDAQDSSHNSPPNWVTDEVMSAIRAYNPSHTRKKLNKQIESYVAEPKSRDYMKYRDYLSDKQRKKAVDYIINNENLDFESFNKISKDLDETLKSKFMDKFVVGDVNVSTYKRMKEHLNSKDLYMKLLTKNPQILNNFEVMEDLNEEFDEEFKFKLSKAIDAKKVNNTDSKVLYQKWSMTPEQKAEHDMHSFYVFLSSMDYESGDREYVDNLVKVNKLDPNAYRTINMMKLRKQVQPGTKMYGIKTDADLLDEYIGKSSKEMDDATIASIKEKAIEIG